MGKKIKKGIVRRYEDAPDFVPRSQASNFNFVFFGVDRVVLDSVAVYIWNMPSPECFCGGWRKYKKMRGAK